MKNHFMTGDEIRKAYLDFFEKKGHSIIPSSSLIPHGDPTLLLTTAGMVQFKPYFLGEETPPSRRLASCQKCFRTTDIESVGDFNHLTYFEMLGNFSIGDYFKEESIKWAWEFVTDVLKLPKERLWITIYLDDEETFAIWRKIGVPESRIVRFGEKDNFWGPAGSSGPCGPCSEIHYDFGADVGCRQPTCTLECRCGRFSEIWNLVFTQFNQDTEGKRTPLPRPNIDTGMGLERITTIMQGKLSVYETDLFAPLIERVSEIGGVKYGKNAATDNTMRIVAEHGRGIAFLIGDGVMPSNEGRGYVLRRLIRRAAYFGETLSHHKPFVTEVARATIDEMDKTYPELAKNREFILEAVESEVEKFQEALHAGHGLLNSTFIALRQNLTEYFPEFKEAFDKALSEGDIAALSSKIREAIDEFQSYCANWERAVSVGGRDIIAQTVSPIQNGLNQMNQAVLDYGGSPRRSFQDLKKDLQAIFGDIQKNVNSIATTLFGYEIFTLHDTYGFPAELTREVAARRGLTVDWAGFEKEMAKQRERARASSRFEVEEVVLGKKEAITEFTGYTSLEAKACIVSLVVKNKPVDSIKEGDEAGIILESTPFYGEMGGQVGDTGKITGLNVEFLVTSTVHAPGDVIVHGGKMVKGTLKTGEEVTASVDGERRLDIARNHTATHLLHSALRKVLGKHAQQRGSLVAPDRLRFDFSHLAPLTKEQVAEIQCLVNEDIRKNLKVACVNMPYKEAMREGAIALFDEKYGDNVRVVKIGEGVSSELCGGTHVNATGEIGLFQIISEGSIGTGLRRIEAVTGEGALEHVQGKLATLDRIAELVSASPSEVENKVAVVTAELGRERKERESLERELSRRISEALLSKVQTVSGVKVLAESVPPTRIEILREMTDWLREKLGSAIIVLGTLQEDKPLFLAAVTPDLTARGYNAGNIVRKVAQLTGGGGGGRANLAQAGGRDKNKMSEALALVKSLIPKGGV